MAVEAVLLALLADDAGDEGEELGVAVGAESVDRVLERAENDVGEGGGEGDGVVEVAGGEDVLAGLDGSAAGGLQNSVRSKGVELLLSLDGSEGIKDDGADSVAALAGYDLGSLLKP